MSIIFFRKGRSLLVKIVGQKNIERAIILLAKLGNLDLLTFSYKNMGILKWSTDEISGEKYVIENVLKGILKDQKPVLFDVGANKGDYAKALRFAFPNSIIHSFEPNAYTFEMLVENVKELNINCHQIGLSSQKSVEKILYL